MAQPSLIISLAAEFIGKKAFKQAETSTERLTKSVKSLGKTLGVTLGARALYNYSKSAVKAFAAEDASIKSLNRTVENLGLGYGYAGTTLNAYLDRLAKATGVMDDQLRPVMETLLRATGSLGKSQEILNQALDISAGTGKDLVSVTAALSKAYLGNKTSLLQLGVGLSKAELTSMSFEEIQTRLNVLFAGQAVTAADSYQGSLNKLAIAGDNAKEIIGKGLVDALATLSGGNIDNAVSAIDSVANSINKAIGSVSRFIAVSKNIFTGGSKLEQDKIMGRWTGIGNISMTKSSQDTQKSAAKAQKKAAADALKLTKAQLAAQKAFLKNQKDQVLQKKLGAIFDLEQIQIAAALKGKISEQDRIKLQLQSALLMGNTDEAARLTLELANSVGLTTQLGQWLSSLPTAANPFEAWESFLYGIQKQVNAIIASVAAGTNVLARFSPSTQASIISSVLSPELFAGIAAGSSATGVSPIGNNASSEMAYRNAVQVVVNVAGSLTTQQDLVTAIQNGLYTRQSTGNAAAYLAP